MADLNEHESMDLHLAALGTEQELPEAALRACVARFDEARQPLRALLDRAAAGKPLSEAEWLRFFRGLHVLAAARDTDSFGSLLRLLRRPADEVDDLLGDAVYVSVPRLLIGLFDGDADALLALATDAKVDDFARSAALEAAIYLTWRTAIDRDLMRRFLLAFGSARSAEDEAPVWFSWMQAVALLDFRDLVPMVEKAWKGGRIDRSIQEWSDFGKDLARAHTAYDDARRFEDLAVGPIDDIVAELDWTRHGAETVAEERAYDDAVEESAAPASNPFRGIGRNDPCPCGSGKKAKKCCLGSA